MRSFEQRIKRSFLFIAFGLSWSMVALLLARPDLPPQYFLFFACLAPAVSAVIVHESTTNHSLAHSLFLTAKPTPAWVLSLFIPFVFFGLYIISFPNEFGVFHQWWFYLFFITAFLEIGWRGFFQKELEVPSFWLSSITIGVLMACWATPILVVFFGLSDFHLLAFAFFFLLIAAPSTFLISLTKSLFPSTILNGFLLYLLTLLFTHSDMLVVFFALLLMLNGITMLAHAVFPHYFTQAFIAKRK
ncbi:MULTISPECIES: hypothetical protein [Bacillaceae]|uniref:Uncharacterized protein n=2 Tax=Bacillaceae TaxID=186817 RepID=A0A9D5HZX6_9BACI|nr:MULTISPECIES: hypothetical protein [Bacillaceae]KQL56388.1 hypothetical protein AN965_13790 [Alkalicoccobacillus plakortidis]MBG9782702.1 hypothetical protein [Shouchella lehensis]RQW21836.1 hypothetical protein EH196_04810 [Bacillus sp. C1-1]TES47679.1 hypothetical protein E2L03_10960 [Shouchella lehensis]